MAHPARQRDETIDKRWRRVKKLTLPSWWVALAPTKGASFWRRVEMERKEAGVLRSDYSGISYIIKQLRRSRHERDRRHHQAAR